MGRRLRGVRSTDVLIVGSGVAGLSAALAMRGPEATLVTPGKLGADGSTGLAQGGIAAALAPDDGPALHLRDTLDAAAGLGNEAAARLLTSEGPEAIRRLAALGARFDLTASGEPALGREAAHARARIVHAGGDATGAEIARALREAVRSTDRVRVEEETAVRSLVRSRGRVVGAVVERHGASQLLLARAVVLCTGGLGALYRHTTNPSWSRGEGLALAARVGAELADLEFVQFHPTALAAGGDPLPLLTEALRGAGAVLVDAAGKRFLLDVDPRGELAPRDLVAAAIWKRLRGGETVFLDGRKAIGDRFAERFPTVFAACRQRGLDPRTDRLPVTPAAHYQMGGIVVDERGRSTVPGLWAAGEVAWTGVHGANRLASNSLLEGLVWGSAAGADAAAALPAQPPATALVREVESRMALPARSASARRETRGSASLDRVRDLLWERVGLEREGSGLTHALEELDGLERRWPADTHRDAVLVARLVTTAALARTESRGAHRRADHPNTDAEWRDHVVLSLGTDGRTIQGRRSGRGGAGAGSGAPGRPRHEAGGGR
ncbi:MAG: L-aspartate oxidase [Thermoanaerobaculia bacterium]